MSATITGYTLNKYTEGSTAPHYQLWVDVTYGSDTLHGDADGPTANGSSFLVDFPVWSASPGHRSITHFHDLGNLSFDENTNSISVKITDNGTVLAETSVNESEAQIKNSEPDGVRPLSGAGR